MYPRDGVGPEEAGAKAGVLGPGLLLLQQVGCWHLNLSSWEFRGSLIHHIVVISTSLSALPFRCPGLTTAH
ncbi:hypothetical protein GOODEAATRI_000159 [Goodea atripinnis]|uniref:Uncharacterized protein n=1 Tax=Goodea atripinnis TaxID=208336 RepID=A0ABV0PJV2_9TELE